MRFLARILIILGAVGVVAGFFLPFLGGNTGIPRVPENTFWNAATAGGWQSAWQFWAILGGAVLAVFIMLIPAKALAGLLHIAVGAGVVYLMYTILGMPELKSLFGSVSIFQAFWSGLDYGGYLLVGGGAAIFFGGIFELAA
jgi:hypothetical protein